MASSLGPVLANLFIGCHDRNWLQEFDIGEVLLYRRYVDDIFCIFTNEINVKHFLSTLTLSIPISHLLWKKKQNKFLPFLDVLVKNEGRKFTTSLYRKKMYIELFT